MFTAMARSSSHRRLATSLLIVLLALGLGWIVYGTMWRPSPETIAGLPSGEDDQASADVIRPLRPTESVETSASPDPANPPDTAAASDEPATTTDVAAVSPTITDDPTATSGPEAVDTPAAPGTDAVPSFDIVRVERDGSAVIAGRAAPGATVDVLAGDRVIDQVTANQRGEWVATPAGSIGSDGEELTLLAKDPDGVSVESEQVVIIAMPPGASVPGPDGAGGDAAQSAEAPVKLTALEAFDQPVAVLLPKGRRGQSRLLQAPGKIVTDGDLALLMVNYDDQGRIELSGEAPPGAPIRVYVDNRPAAMVVADAKGHWTTGLDEPLTPGTYTLRLDQLDPSGQTTARLETPFTRVAERPADRDPQVDYVVVQPGNSLWRIARRLYGSGNVYVHIYDANQAQIKDPDMIYPGQVFEVPADVSSAG